MFVEKVKDNLRIAFTLKLDNYTDAIAVAFIPEVGDSFDLLIPH